MTAAASPPLARELEHCAALDRRLVAAIRSIRILPTVAWPPTIERSFLALGEGAAPRLPHVHYTPPDLSRERAELEAIHNEADAAHPLGEYLRSTAASWLTAAAMLEAIGTPVVSALSATLYGSPGDAIPGSTLSNIDAARHFVAVADELGASHADDGSAATLSAETLRADLMPALDALFGAGRIAVEIDPDLTAKAAAGATRIRLRASSCFSEYDCHQLLAHEAFVHTLTALNGREQPHLRSFGRTSPRATATQEGLAVFAELISGSIDIGRLKRISLRILAIDMALGGADFVEVYRYFSARGQSAADSFHSAQRVFRGVPLTGGAAFAKDNVYLSGLLTVHTFFRWALQRRRLDLLRHLFAGKLALQDVISLQPHFASGVILPPRWLPPWMQHAQGLAGKLAFSVFVNGIHMGRVDGDELLSSV